MKMPRLLLPTQHFAAVVSIQPTGFERKCDEIWMFSGIAEIPKRVVQKHLPALCRQW